MTKNFVSEHPTTVAYIAVGNLPAYYALFKNHYYRNKALEILENVDGVISFALHGRSRLAKQALRKWSNGQSSVTEIGGIKLDVVQ